MQMHFVVQVDKDVQMHSASTTNGMKYNEYYQYWEKK